MSRVESFIQMRRSASLYSESRGVVSSGWLAADSTYGQVNRRKTGSAWAVSVMVHGAGVFIALAVMSIAPDPAPSLQVVAEKYDLIFASAGPGGGGGRTLAMKATPPPPSVIAPVLAPPPPPTLVAPVHTVAALLPTTGVISGLAAAPSRGPGTGGGGGPGKGTGAGPGDGPGAGPGSDGGVGGGPMGPGSGASPPTVLRSVEPKYTVAAMQAKIQGTVQMEVLVSPSGTVTDVKVIRSLDRIYGLDTQAVATAKQWLFQPARFQGQPVAYIVIIELLFNLR